MSVLALLLVMVLRVETNVTDRAENVILKCHVCEKENRFDCTGAQNCDKDVHYCVVAAIRIFPRFFYVTKRCAKVCPFQQVMNLRARRFVLVKPTPFCFLRCCTRALCNEQPPNLPNVNQTYRVGGAGRGCAGLGPPLSLSAVALGVRLL